MIEIVGALVLTLIPVVVTGWFIGMLYTQWAWGGLSILTWKDWFFVAIFIALLVFGWWVWWTWVGSAITISIGVSA